MTPHEHFDNWSILTDQLTGPRKTGGLTSIGGFAFQEAYTCLYLARLLDPQPQVIAVRYEGAQDLDLFYADGRENYAQLKNEPSARYTLRKLRPVLQGFAADLLESNGKGALGFELVARSNDIDPAVERLRSKRWWEKDLSDVAALLSESTESSAAPKCLRNLSESERRDLAERLLRCTTFSFGMGDEVEGRLSFQSHTCMELAKHGVAGPDLQNAFEALRAALKPQRTFTRDDVQAILKRFIGGAAIELFEGRVESLTDELLSKPAKPEEVALFYKNEALLDWSIIAARGDVKRDQQESLIAQLSVPHEGLRLVCLLGEPGEGKSTLAWRVAAELHKRQGAFVVRVKFKEDADVWYRVPAFCQKVGHPLYILADDLFRFPEVVAALGELDAELPVTILATSRTNEYRPPRIKGKVSTVALEAPSWDEKQRILERVGKSRAKLTPEQQARLDDANLFLVLMMETTEGEELSEFIRDVLRLLRKQDESAYRAYEYVSFSSQYGLLMPESLLAHLDDQGRFHKLPDRPSARGLIFYDEGIPGKVRASHPIFAATAAKLYASLSRDPAIVLREIVGKADPSDPWERRFVAHLLKMIAQTKSPALDAALPHIETSLTNLQRYATVGDLTIWRNMYKALGREELAEGCIDRALTLKPLSSIDCQCLLGLFRERKREKEALPPIAEWVRANPDLYGGREVYLSLVDNYGSYEEKETAIEEFGTWLAQHQDEVNTWAKYIGLVGRHGSHQQIEHMLQTTGQWLRQHPDDYHLRVAFLKTMERSGTEEQARLVIQQTGEWLAQHQDYAQVRVNYLSLVELRGSPQQAERAIKEIGTWLTQHPDDHQVRVIYLGLVESRGGTEQVEKVIGETKEWLRHHTWAENVWEALLAILIRSGRVDETAELSRQAIFHHPHNQNLFHQYMRSLRDADYGEGVKQAFEKLLSDLPHAENIIVYFAEWLIKHEHLAEARRLYIRTLKSHSENIYIRQRYAQLLLKEERFGEAIEEFLKVIKVKREHRIAHDSLGYALSKLGEMAESEGKREYAERFFAHAEREFRLAINYSKMADLSPAMFYNHLGWFYFARGRYEEALMTYKSAIEWNPDSSNSYFGISRVQFATGQFRDAEEALVKALEKAPEVLQQQARDEMHEWLKVYREALSQNADD